MKIAASDILPLSLFGASGGFAGLFAAAGFVFPAHQNQFNGAAAVTVAACTTVAGILRIASSPAPPPGTFSANIPVGSIPVVGISTGPGTQVAHVDPATTTVSTIAPKT